MKELWISLFVLIIFSSCYQNKRGVECYKKTENLLNITVKDQRNEVNIGEYLDSVDILPLKMNKGDYLYAIDKLIITKNRIHILDIKQNSVYSFTKEGDFINKVSKLGRGSEEYPNISDFSIDGDTVIIFNRDVVYRYDVSGKYYGKVKLNFVANKMECINGNYAFYRGYNTSFKDYEYYYNLIVTDKNGDIVSKNFPYTKDAMGIGSVFCRNGEKINFVSIENNTIYEFDDYEPIPHVAIHFAEPENKNETSFISNFRETKHSITFDIVGGNAGTAMVSKLDSSSLVLNKRKADDNYIFIGASPYAVYDNKVFSILESHEYKIMMEDEPVIYSSIKEHYPQYETVFNLIKSENANPVLIMETYKETYQ